MSILSVGAAELEKMPEDALDMGLTEEEWEAFKEHNEKQRAYVYEHLDEIRAEADEYQRTTPQTKGYVYDGFYYKDGDIIVTDSTSSAGLTGHCGIVVGEKVLEITKGANKGNPTGISFATWFQKYPDNIVIRSKSTDRTVPVEAPWYGQSFYIDGAGKNNTYALNYNLTSETTDYCSSLVWKCFYRGADLEFLVYSGSPNGGQDWYRPAIISLYDYIHFADYNGFRQVHYVNWTPIKE